MPLMLTPEGVAVNVPLDQVQAARNVGYKDATPTQAAPDLTRSDSIASGPLGTAVAGVTGAFAGATLGGTDALIAAAAPRGMVQDVREARAAHPIVSTIGEVGGAVLPAFLTGGESLIGAPTRLASGAGRAAAGAAEAAGVGQFGAAAIGGAAEGALYGAGSGVSELALSQDPLTVERIASSLSSHALYGAGIGGAAGTLGKAAELGLRRAKGAIDEALEKRALRKAKTPTEAIESGDLSKVDNRILDAVERDEIARLKVEQAPQREAFTKELDTWRKANRDAHELREITQQSPDVNLREASGAFDRANLELRKALDNKIKFTKDPARSLEAVQRQAQALEEMHAAATAQQRAWRVEVDTAPERFRAMIEEISSKPTLAERTAASRKLGFTDYTGPFTPAGLDFAVERALKEYSELSGEAIRNGLREPSIVKRLPKIEGMIAANQRLQGQLEALAKPPTSDLLTKIADARATLNAPKEPSLGQTGQAVLGAVAPFAGPVGVAAVAGNRVLGSFKQLASAATTRVGKAASGFLGVAAPATKYATPLATKVLTAARFSDDDDRKKQQPSSLPELYKARTTEIKQQVHIAADGSYQMRPGARAKMAAKFDGIRVADPILADRLESSGALRIEYLASILPRLPDFGTVQVGPERRQVSELAMRAWTRSVRALEDPAGVFERAAHGRVLPEEVKALRAVHPQLLDAFTREVLGGLTSLKKNLSPRKRLALSMLTGQPVDPTLTPTVLRVVQGMYASEPGTAGGTQAPRAQAQFGSVKRSDPGTASQRRQEGTST